MIAIDFLLSSDIMKEKRNIIISFLPPSRYDVPFILFKPFNAKYYTNGRELDYQLFFVVK